MHIYLIGFMGAGKTTIGKLLAKKLGRDFIDLDETIEQETGLTIPGIFKEKGQEYFRQQESRALHHLSSSSSKIIATGGGVILSSENREVMKNTGVTVYLSWPISVLFKRIQHSQNRPLLKNASLENLFVHIQNMLNERLPFYKSADFIIHGDEKTSPDQSVDMILEQLQPKFMKTK